MMKKITFKRIFLALAMIASMSISAQQKQKDVAAQEIQLTDDNQKYLEEYGVVRCLTVENEEYLQQRFPKRATTQEFEETLAPIIARIKADRAAGRVMPVYNIPVVVHVMHNGEAIGTAPNITDAQVISQIDVFNEDFRRMVGTPGGANSTGVAVDVEINFCLAQQDAAGNPTTGINRVNMGQDGINAASNGAALAAFDAIKPASQWDPTKYMNMWSVKFTGGASTLLGYAQFPDNTPGLGGLNPSGGAANTDGVVAAYHTFGSSDKDDGSFLLNAPYDKGRTMTHEVGHWLGLRHIWGDTPACTNDDFCADTPDSTTSNGGCPTVDNCPADGLGNDQVQNYMDYTNDTCMDTFTQDQKDRMVAVMQASPRRVELNSSIGCQSPTAVTFTLAASPASQTNCGSDSVDYTINMTTLNGFSETTTFTVSGLPAGATDVFTPPTLNSTASTTLTVGNLSGATDGNYPLVITGTSASVTQTANVTLVVGTGVCASTGTKDYNTAITYVGFNTIANTTSPDGSGAEGTGYTDNTATINTTVNRESSYNLNIRVDPDGQYRTQTKVWIDWNQNCVFDIATEEYDLGNADVSAPTGPWYDIATTNSPLSVTVPSDAVLGNTVMRVATIYSQPTAPYNYPTSCGTNTDGEVEDYRIIVTHSLSVAQSDFTTFDVYPNPSKGNINVTISTGENVKVSLFDIRGRKVSGSTYQNNSPIFNEEINLGNLSSGMYIFTVESGAKKATQKIIIE